MLCPCADQESIKNDQFRGHTPSDYVTRELFDGILKSEESHVDWLETNLELIKKMGIQNYIQSQAN